jgi:hypothetical protein
MRRVPWVAAAVVLGLGWQAESPAEAEMKWRPAVEAGANLSSWHPGGADPNPYSVGKSNPYATDTGFYVGGSISVRGRHLGIRAGLQFARRGTQIPADPESVHTDYIDLPVLAEARARAVHGVQPLLLGGLAASYRVGARSTQFPDADLSESINATDVGVVIGVALEVRRVALEAKYTWGLAKVLSSSSDRAVYNRCWSLGLRLRL